MERNYSMRNITKMDYKNNLCWWVRIYKKGDTSKSIPLSKCFSIKKYGGWDQALLEAKKWRDDQEEKLCNEGKLSNLRFDRVRSDLRRDNSSGVSGVHYCMEFNGKTKLLREYYSATFSPEKGIYKSKKFLINSKRNTEEALEEAIIYRKLMVKEILSKKKESI